MNFSNYSAELVIILGALIVWLAALRFNDPRILVARTPDYNTGWRDHIKHILSWKPARACC